MSSAAFRQRVMLADHLPRCADDRHDYRLVAIFAEHQPALTDWPVLLQFDAEALAAYADHLELLPVRCGARTAKGSQCTLAAFPYRHAGSELCVAHRPKASA